jgi:hypothetical protein
LKRIRSVHIPVIARGAVVGKPDGQGRSEKLSAQGGRLTIPVYRCFLLEPGRFRQVKAPRVRRLRFQSVLHANPASNPDHDQLRPAN